MTTLALVRHGETALNVEKRFRGRADPLLTAHGEAQASVVAIALAKLKPVAIVASPRRRAVETANIIADHPSCVDAEISLDPRLDDIDYGQWSSKTDDEVRAQWPTDYRTWREEPEKLTLPHGEPVAAVRDRMYEVIASRVPTNVNVSSDATIVFVTHDMLIRLAICDALGAPLASLHRIQIDLCSITLLRVTTNLVIERMNDTSHYDLLAPRS